MSNKTIKNKTIKNKTVKNKTIYTPKFILNIIKEWKKQTKGFVQKDQKYDSEYYLSFSTKTSDYNNHIHLHIQNHNNSYMMKKFNISNKKIVHSKHFPISIHSNPKTVVQNMIKNYNKFIHVS